MKIKELLEKQGVDFSLFLFNAYLAIKNERISREKWLNEALGNLSRYWQKQQNEEFLNSLDFDELEELVIKIELEIHTDLSDCLELVGDIYKFR